MECWLWKAEFPLLPLLSQFVEALSALWAHLKCIERVAYTELSVIAHLIKYRAQAVDVINLCFLDARVTRKWLIQNLVGRNAALLSLGRPSPRDSMFWALV